MTWLRFHLCPAITWIATLLGSLWLSPFPLFTHPLLLGNPHLHLSNWQSCELGESRATGTHCLLILIQITKVHLSDVVGLTLCGRALGMLINFNLLERCPKSQRRQLAFCEVICKYPAPPLQSTMPCYYVISRVKGSCFFFFLTYLTFFLGPYKEGCVCDSVSNIFSWGGLL